MLAAVLTALIAASTFSPTALADELEDELEGLVNKKEWKPINTTLSDSQQEALAALGYLDGYVTAPDLIGVTRSTPAKMQRGYTVIASSHGPEIYMVDEAGTVVHTWAYDLAEWPEIEDRPKYVPKKWYRAHLYADGGVLVALGAQGLIRLDKDSKLLWAVGNRAHHDVQVLDDGSILTLTRHLEDRPEIGTEKVLMDYVVKLDANGKTLSQVAIGDAFDKGDPTYKKIWTDTGRVAGDIFHANSVELVDSRLAGRLPSVNVGDVLISLRELSAVVTIDMAAGKVTWGTTGDFRQQHDARVVNDGDLMIFDNRHRGQKASSVEIYDPATMTQKWIFEGTDPEPFFSLTSGRNQPLANGNVLAVESNNGRVVEVTPAGEIVWEYWNPHRAGDQDELIASINDAERVDPSYVGWLK